MSDTTFARKVLNHLRAHPEQHRQAVWGTRTACGTTACIAGTALLMDPDSEVPWVEYGDGWVFGLDLPNTVVNGETVDGVRRAADLLGVPPILFYITDEAEALEALEHYITSAELMAEQRAALAPAREAAMTGHIVGYHEAADTPVPELVPVG